MIYFKPIVLTRTIGRPEALDITIENLSKHESELLAKEQLKQKDVEKGRSLSEIRGLEQLREKRRVEKSIKQKKNPPKEKTEKAPKPKQQSKKNPNQASIDAIMKDSLAKMFKKSLQS